MTQTTVLHKIRNSIHRVLVTLGVLKAKRRKHTIGSGNKSAEFSRHVLATILSRPDLQHYVGCKTVKDGIEFADMLVAAGVCPIVVRTISEVKPGRVKVTLVDLGHAGNPAPGGAQEAAVTYLHGAEAIKCLGEPTGFPVTIAPTSHLSSGWTTKNAFSAIHCLHKINNPNYVTLILARVNRAKRREGSLRTPEVNCINGKLV